jgi:hypothetical protein
MSLIIFKAFVYEVAKLTIVGMDEWGEKYCSIGQKSKDNVFLYTHISQGSEFHNMSATCQP